MMCTDADHARNGESELLSLLREQVRVSERLLRESEQTNKLLMALVDVLSEEQMGEPDDEQEPTTYLDGTPVR